MTRVAAIYLLALAGIGVLGSCKKDPQSGYSVMFVNASLNQSQVDVYANSQIIFQDLAYPDSSGYLTFGQPAIRLTIYPNGNGGSPVYNGLYELSDQTRNYSFFLLDSAGGAVQGTLVHDQLTPPAQGSANIRFLNFAYTTPGVDLVNAGNGDILFTDVGFNLTGGQYVTVAADTYSFNVRATGALTLLTSVNGVELVNGGVYTLFLRGIDGGIGTQALEVSVIHNN